MPAYPHRCKGPEAHSFDIIKPMSQYDRPEVCPLCESPAERLIALSNIDKEAAGGWNQQSWNPALGQWTKSTKDARKIAKSRGMEEIGNEPVENLHKIADKTREETRKQRWRDADRVMKYD